MSDICAVFSGVELFFVSILRCVCVGAAFTHVEVGRVWVHFGGFRGEMCVQCVSEVLTVGVVAVLTGN